MKKLYSLLGAALLGLFALSGCDIKEEVDPAWKEAALLTPAGKSIIYNPANRNKTLPISWTTGTSGIEKPTYSVLLVPKGGDPKTKFEVLLSGGQDTFKKDLEVSYKALSAAAVKLGGVASTDKVQPITNLQDYSIVVRTEAAGQAATYSAPIAVKVSPWVRPAAVWAAPLMLAPKAVEPAQIENYTFGWDLKHEGIYTPITYKVELTTKLTAEKDTVIMLESSANELNVNVNDIAKNINAIDGSVMDFKAKVTLSSVDELDGNKAKTLASNVVSFKHTAMVMPEKLYLVGDFAGHAWDNAYNGFELKPNGKNGELEGIYKFNSMFKILEKLGQWQPQWGDNGADGTLEGSNNGDPATINPAAPGWYKLVVNWSTKTYTLTPSYDPTSVLYMVGPMIGWDITKALPMENKQGSFELASYLLNKDGGFLFVPRQEGSAWGEKWGTNTPGQLVKGDGANIAVPATGFYLVKADTEKLTYSLTELGWGVIGDATPGGWGSDTDMTFDPESKTYTAELDLLANKTIKVRFGDGWDLNVGDGNKVGGDNIAITTAGKYRVTLKYVDDMPLNPYGYTGAYELKVEKL